MSERKKHSRHRYPKYAVVEVPTEKAVTIWRLCKTRGDKRFGLLQFTHEAIDEKIKRENGNGKGV